MYLHRQLAPDPEASWIEIKKMQVRMRERIEEQQVRDMREFQHELAGWRLPPTRPVGSLRKNMWLDGRVCFLKDYGVMVDVGAYNETGGWCDGYLPMSQMAMDGRYTGKDDIKDLVYLGEHVRVRVTECTPAVGQFTLSMREYEDMPELFIGMPRPYTLYDLRVGMEVTGVVRRVFNRQALVDIGADRLAMLAVWDHPKKKDEYGLPIHTVQYEFAPDVYHRGSKMQVWIKSVDDRNMRITVSCNPVYVKKSVNEELAENSQGMPFQRGPVQVERMSPGKRKDLERQEAEGETWDPYVPHVTEFLEAAKMPDDELDNWVAQQELDLFQDSDDLVDDFQGPQTQQPHEASFADDFEEFADDEFDEDEFPADSFQASSSSSDSFGDWELDDA